MHSDSRVKVPVCLATTSLPDPCLSTYLSPRFREEPFFSCYIPIKAGLNSYFSTKNMGDADVKTCFPGNVFGAVIDLTQGFSRVTYQKVTHGYFLLHPNPMAFCRPY
jgi:hypothetical protein